MMRKKLEEWFADNHRELPWRWVKDPYLIWLSEIILQQTRVEQGLSYYRNFCLQYPTIWHLAKAPEEEVLRLWQGLGYYTRARNLHKTAKIITETFDGVFPNTFEEIRKLPGIGDYTASAIASFAFNLSYPVLDGNSARVVSRIFGVFTPIDTPAGKAALMHILNKQIGHKNPGLFNQAIMDFGAMLCKPQKPLCETCPFFKTCYAFNHKTTGVLPIKQNKTKVKQRRLDYLVCIEGTEIWFKKRIKSDIWQHLYDFPEIDEQTAKQFKKKQLLQIDKQTLSHQHLTILFWEIEQIPEKQKEGCQKIQLSELSSYAMPNPMSRFVFNHPRFMKPFE